MKLTIKTLAHSTFTVVTEPDKTVKDLKEQIEKEHGHGKEYPSGAQKLIYSGKILADESKLSEYNIDEKKFIVLMITRPPPAPKAPVVEKPASSSSVKTETTDTKTKTTDDKANSKSSTSSSATSVSNPTTTPSTNQPATRSSARLSSSANNPPPAATNTTTTTTTNSASNNEASLLSAMGEPQMATRLAMLMSQPQFRHIQDLIQQSPHLLSQTIEALAASDPEMYNFISENPDVFVNALNHPPMAGLRSQASRNTPGDQQQGRPAEGQQAGRQGPGVEQLIGNVSEHDKEAIERLKELGFSEYLAVQAYMACDKDEQLAANLLFQMDQ